MDFTYADLAGMIDHSLLQQTLTDAELEQGCQLAREYQVASVCIKPYFVQRAAALLAGSKVAVGTTIGFPQGGHVTVDQGCRGGPGHCRRCPRTGHGGQHRQGAVEGLGLCAPTTFAAVVDLAHRHGAIVKVIFENCFLQDEHKERLCQICGEVRADFVKTSTGYGSTGATDEDLRLMRRCSPPHVQVKAAGGVRTFERLLAVRALGVTRVGATATKVILDDCKKALGGSGS